MKAARIFGGCCLILALAGCPTREFYLSQSEVPWETEGIHQVEVPAFEAPAAGWAAADAARREIADALGRGTVDVVPRGGQAVLHGALTQYEETTGLGPPRRVLRQTSTLSGDTYAWELDATFTVSVRLSVRLIDANGGIVWSKEGDGIATETRAFDVNWPGSDPVPPPAQLPYPPDPGTFQRLRDTALEQAVKPLVDALTIHYGYKDLR